MVWTKVTRARYRRIGVGYASDMSDAEWAIVAAHLPVPSRLGRPRRTSPRRIVDALLYILWSGCPWRGLPRDFPPFTTVQYHFYRWRDQGWWSRHPGQRAGQSGRGSAAQSTSLQVSGPAPRLFRPHLSWCQTARGRRQPVPLDHRDHHPVAKCRPLRPRTPAMGRRTHLRLAGQKPTPRQGLRSLTAITRSMGQPRLHQNTFSPTRQSTIMSQTLRCG